MANFKNLQIVQTLMALFYARRYKVFAKELICGWLAAAMALQPVAWAQSAAVSESATIPVSPSATLKQIKESVSDPLVKLNQELAEALINAMYYGSPGLAKVPPSRQEIADLAKKLQTWRVQLEQQMNEHISTTDPVDLTVGLSRVVGIANLYFKLAMALEQLRVLSGETLELNSWDSRFSLNLDLRPQSDFILIESLAGVNQKFGEEGINFYTELDLENDQLILKPLSRESRPIEEQRLGLDRSDEAGVNLAQYLTTLFLTFNQLQMQSLLQQPLRLNLPEKLTNKFPGLKDVPTIFKEAQDLDRRQAIAREVRKNLASWLTELNNKNHYLANENLLREILVSMGHTALAQPENKALLSQQLKEAFQPLEQNNGTLAALNLVGLLKYDPMTVEGLQFHLAAAIAEAKAMALQNETLTAKNSEGQPLTTEQSEKIKELIYQSRISYTIAIAPLLKEPAANTLQAVQKKREEERLKKIDQIITSAGKFNQLSKDENVDVDPGALIAAVSPSLKKLSFSENGKEQLGYLSKTSNYEQARSRFHELLIQHLSLFKNPKADVPLTAELQVDLPMTKRWLKEAQFSDEIWSKALAQHPEVASLAKPVPNIMKQDALSWVEAGQILGFDRFPMVKPKVKDFKFDRAEKAAYFEELRLRMLTEFPLFDLALRDHQGEPVKLHQQLEFLQNAGVTIEHQRPTVTDAIQKMIDIIHLNYEVVAGNTPSLWEKLRIKTGFQTEQDPTIKFFHIMVSATGLAGQIGMYPGLFAAYSKTVTEMAEAYWPQRAWSKIVGVNQQIMWAVIAWTAATMLVRLPVRTVSNFFLRFQSTILKSTTKALSNSKALGFVEKALSKSSAALSSVESAVLAPAFGVGLSRLNWAILGIFVAHLGFSGVDAFYIQPQNRNDVVPFYTCSISSPCVVNARSMQKWHDEVSGLQAKWMLEVATMVLFIGAVWGLSHLFSKTLPTWRLNRLTKDMQQMQRDIGFQNGRYSFHPNDIDDMAEATIQSLHSKVHPAFNPNKPLPDHVQKQIQDKGSRAGLSQSEIAQRMQQTQVDFVNLAKAGMAQRIRARTTDLKYLVRQEELFWRKWEVQLRPHLLMFNNQGRFPTPLEMLQFANDIQVKFKAGSLSREQYVYLFDSYRKVENFVFPHYLRASTDEVYRALLARTFGVHQSAFLRSGDLSKIKLFGGGYMTIRRAGGTISKNHQLTELGAAENQVAVRTTRYKIENDAWWDYLRQFTDPKDFPMTNNLKQLSGPPSTALLGVREVRLLQNFSKGKTP